MKFKKLIKYFGFLGTITALAVVTTTSLTDSDVKTVKPFRLNEDDKKYYANLYTGKGNVFDKLGITEFRNKLLKERKLRKHRPSVGVIEIDTPKIFDGMLRSGTKQEVILIKANKIIAPKLDHHSSLVTSLLATSSGVNPFADVYNVALSFGFTIESIEEALEKMHRKGISIVNMSLGDTYSLKAAIAEKWSVYLRDTSYSSVFNTKQRTNEKITLQDINDFIENKQNLNSHNDIDIPSIAFNVHNHFTEWGVKAMLLTLSKALADVTKEFYERNQYYSEYSRMLDRITNKYDMKIFVSAGNAQLLTPKIERYYDNLVRYGYEPDNFEHRFKFIPRPDKAKTARNVFYIGALDIATNQSALYSTVGTKYHDDYPFVSGFADFTISSNKYKNLMNVHPYIRSYANYSSYKDYDKLYDFIKLKGTSFSTPIVAGLVSLLEYDLQRKISISELKTAFALNSIEPSITEWSRAESVNNHNFEKRTRTGTLHRSGFGAPSYKKLREYFLKQNQSKTEKFYKIKNEKNINSIFENVVVPPHQTIKIALSWDYISNRHYDWHLDEIGWEDRENQLLFGRYIDALKIALQGENFVLEDRYNNFNDPIFSTVRVYTFTNQSEVPKTFSIGVKEIKTNENIVKLNDNGNFTIGYKIE